MSAKLPTALSFSGCGFLGVYHIGVARCFQLHGRQLLDITKKFGGASAGSLAAVVLAVCPDRIMQCRDIVYNLATETRGLALGPLNKKFKLSKKVETMVDSVLPNDAHLSAKDRVFISITRKRGKKNFIISDFSSREDLIQCLVSSCHIPYYSGKHYPIFRGEKYYDGGFTNNLVDLSNGDDTVFITPFSGGLSYICPNDPIKRLNVTFNNQNFCVNFRNLSRGIDALVPPAPKTLDRYYEQGFIDGLRYLAQLGEKHPQTFTNVGDLHKRHRLLSTARDLRLRSAARESIDSLESDSQSDDSLGSKHSEQKIEHCPSEPTSDHIGHGNRSHNENSKKG